MLHRFPPRRKPTFAPHTRGGNAQKWGMYTYAKFIPRARGWDMFEKVPGNQTERSPHVRQDVMRFRVSIVA